MEPSSCCALYRTVRTGTPILLKCSRARPARSWVAQRVMIIIIFIPCSRLLNRVFVKKSQSWFNLRSLYASSAFFTRSSTMSKLAPKPVTVPPGLVDKYECSPRPPSTAQSFMLPDPGLILVLGNTSQYTGMSAEAFCSWMAFLTVLANVLDNSSLYEAVITCAPGSCPRAHSVNREAVLLLPCLGGMHITKIRSSL